MGHDSVNEPIRPDEPQLPPPSNRSGITSNPSKTGRQKPTGGQTVGELRNQCTSCAQLKNSPGLPVTSSEGAGRTRFSLCLRRRNAGSPLLALDSQLMADDEITGSSPGRNQKGRETPWHRSSRMRLSSSVKSCDTRPTSRTIPALLAVDWRWVCGIHSDRRTHCRRPGLQAWSTRNQRSMHRPAECGQPPSPSTWHSRQDSMHSAQLRVLPELTPAQRRLGDGPEQPASPEGSARHLVGGDGPTPVGGQMRLGRAFRIPSAQLRVAEEVK